MKFEFLPNEIFFECFEYLNAFHIFHSFDKLNNRFNQLIRHIRLQINFNDVNKTLFDEFCTKMLLNPEIINQIYSFQVMNKEEYHPYHTFLSYISLSQLTHLQKYESILPLFNIKTQLVELLSGKLQILSLSNIKWCPLELPRSLTIINLKVSECNIETLYKLLECLPLLKYLHIKDLQFPYADETTSNWCGLYLKRLTIDECKYKFKDLEIFLKRIPNLKHLNISSSDNIDMIDANDWEKLITSSLPHLNYFKFIFNCAFQNVNINKFQTKFWQEQHHWLIEYIITKNYPVIYTLPYFSNTFILSSIHPKSSNTFQNVTNLTLYPEILKENCEYYFSNVTSLTLMDPKRMILTINDLKRIINLYNIKHLEISEIYFEKGVSKIFEDLPNLTSLSITTWYLNILLKNNELCKYFNKIIRKLYLNGALSDSHTGSPDTKSFCNIFSDIEHLECTIYRSDYGLYLLKNLPKLSTACIRCISERDFDEFINELLKQNIIYDIDEHYCNEYGEARHENDQWTEKIISMWIGISS